MQGIANYVPVIGYLSEAPLLNEFMLIDIGCSGGIDSVWRGFGPRLRALAIDPNVAEIERLQSSETYPGVQYLAAFAGLPADHPFSLRKAGRDTLERSPWPRLSVVKSLELMKSQRQMLPPELGKAVLAPETKLSDEVIVVPAYLRDNRIHSVDFLKIDVDGIDFEILNSFDLALETLGVLGVGIEVNYFGSAADTDQTFHNVDRFMKARGFEFFGTTVRRYSLASLPAPYVSNFPAESEFGRPFQGDALYVRDLGRDEHDEFAARSPLAKLLNLICIFAAFNLPDCAADIALRFRDRLSDSCDVERILDLLAAQAQGPIENPLTYREYLRRFESHDPMFFPQSAASTAAENELACLRAAAAEIQRERDEYAAREQAVQAELEQTRQHLRATLEEARQAREDHAAREQAVQAELEQTRQRLQTTLEAARQALARITSMESSKFWKLRRIWFRLKRCVGLGMNE
jgi:Methyltransferase FkbM domain